MSKGVKIIVFLLLIILLMVGVTILETYLDVTGPFYTIGALLIYLLYRAMFRKNPKTKQQKANPHVPIVEPETQIAKDHSVASNAMAPHEHNLSGKDQTSVNNSKESTSKHIDDFDYQGEIDTIKRQKQILNDLKNDNLLTQEEYQEKVEILAKKMTELEQKKNEAEFQLHQKALDLRIWEELEPTVKKLDVLLKSGVINKDEYKAKKEKAFSDKKKDFKEINIETINFNELGIGQKNTIIRHLQKSDCNVILMDSRTREFSAITQHRFDQMKLTEQIKTYIYVILPPDIKNLPEQSWR